MKRKQFIKSAASVVAGVLVGETVPVSDALAQNTPIGRLENIPNDRTEFVVQLRPGKTVTVNVRKKGRQSYWVSFNRDGVLFHLFRRPGGIGDRDPNGVQVKSFKNETLSPIKITILSKYSKYWDTDRYNMLPRIEREDTTSSEIGWKQDRSTGSYEDIVTRVELS